MWPLGHAEILTLTAHAVAEIAGCRTSGILLDRAWQDVGNRGRGLLPVDVAQCGKHVDGGPIVQDGVAWSWVYPMPVGRGATGYVVVSADTEPAVGDRALLQAIVRLAGAALAVATTQSCERGRVAELCSANLALRRSTDMHDRLTQAVMAGGQGSLANAIQRLTGREAGTRDAFGNLVAWAGAGRPERDPGGGQGRRSPALNPGLAAPGLGRDGPWLVAVAQLAGTPVGAVVLADPEGTAGEAELAVITYASTLLAMEVARLQNLGESRAQARARLALDLVSGGGEQSLLSRAQMLGYNLLRPHRVVSVEPSPGSVSSISVLFDAVSRAARALSAGELLAQRTDDIILLADKEAAWERLYERVVTESGGAGCSIGVGGQCEQVTGFVRSHREAKLALRIQAAVGNPDKVVVFDDLGVYQVLATEADTSAMESFVADRLGGLMRYDAARGTELVLTLTEFLESGGSYNKTASALAIHRSTLKYRLKRVREVSGHDLSLPDVQFNLQVATRAWRTMQALGES
jgi:sugar diacid utilization regulator